MDIAADMGTLIDVPMNQLFINHDFNHRGRVAPIDVADFARSLERDGLKTPITIQPYNDPTHPELKYMVVAGHRRAMAFKIMKRTSIPGFLKHYNSELDARKESLIENLHRKDLNIKQEAHALVPFIKAYWGEKELGEHLGQSTGWVRIRKMLLNLPDRIQDVAAAGLITQEHIRQMQGKNEEQQFAFVREIKEAKARGEKLDIDKVVKKVNPHVLKMRSRPEIFEMITRLYEIMGKMGMHTRALSWSSGQISEYEFMKDVEAYCIENGLAYRVPNSMALEKFTP